MKSTDFTPDTSIVASTAFALHRFRLDRLISEIKLFFYHLPSQLNIYAWPEDVNDLQGSIRRRLQDWKGEISTIINCLPELSIEDRLAYRKQEMKLESQYYATMVLLHQPSQSMPRPNEEALLLCYQCASNRLNVYNDLYQADSLYQSWRSVQGVFSSGATMIYCLWTSPIVQATIPRVDALRDLRTCSNLLSVGGEWWPSVKRGKENFGRAMDAILRRLDLVQDQNKRRMIQSVNLERHLRQNSSEIPPSAHQPLNQDPGILPHMDFPTDLNETDWALLGGGENHPLENFSQDNLDFYHTDLGTADSTVEAFIAEFLNPDASWNPF